MQYFVTAIGTDSGKTVVSAILAQALGADYWKPVQSGLPKDSDMIRKLVQKKIFIHPETYVLKTPISPHAAAKIDDIEIDLNKFLIPKHNQGLIIEGAGGLLVPLNEKEYIADLIFKLQVPIILVINIYLGCINHSLLTLEAIKSRRLTLKGIIFNGEPNAETENIILKKAESRCLLRINKESEVNPKMIKKYADILREKWEPG